MIPEQWAQLLMFGGFGFMCAMGGVAVVIMAWRYR